MNRRATARLDRVRRMGSGESQLAVEQETRSTLSRGAAGYRSETDWHRARPAVTT